MAINSKFSETGARSILELLQSNVRFIVPRFQRNYSWSTERTEAMWNDIVDNFRGFLKNENNIKEYQYLLGPIVLVNRKEPNSFDIIDGQQRMSTLTMLFCVARDIILEDLRKEDSKPDGFEKILEMVQNTLMGKHQSWKLQLNDTDRKFFERIQEYERDDLTPLERIKKEKSKTPSLKLLKENYIYLHGVITEALHTNFEKSEKIDIGSKSDEEKRLLRINNHPMLLYFLTYVRESNYVILIRVADDNAAFQIFETLNERGQTLSKSNLIKNYILNKIKDDADMQKDQSDTWNRIFDEIINDQPDDDFIIESYHSRLEDNNSLRTKKTDHNLPEMSKKNLYKVIKKMVDDESECKKFIKELDEDAAFLSTLNDPSKYSDSDSSDDIRAMKALNAKSIRVPLLAAYRMWIERPSSSNYPDYRKLISLLVKFFFKIRVVRGLHPEKIDNMMQVMTKMINDGETFDTIHSWIIKQDSHEDFEIDFQRKFASKPSSNAAKYALQQITIDLGNPHSDVKPLDNLTLEHILPKNYEEHWNSTEFFDDADKHDIKEISEFVGRLGNLTLLTKSINAKVHNNSFIIKKTQKDPKTGDSIGYDSSELKINKQTVCNHDKWTAKVISEREKQFVDLASKIWML